MGQAASVKLGCGIGYLRNYLRGATWVPQHAGKQVFERVRGRKLASRQPLAVVVHDIEDRDNGWMEDANQSSVEIFHWMKHHCLSAREIARLRGKPGPNSFERLKPLRYQRTVVRNHREEPP